jgi:thiosulfate/3-mercaptopyruvate sulfurtransferase
MLAQRTSRLIKLLCIAAVLAAMSAAATGYLSTLHEALAAQSAAPPTHVQSDPWSTSQTIKPLELIKQLADSNGTAKPVVVCVGFRPLYMGAHVPGAVFHGAAQSEQGLADLKKWARGVSRSANLVVYCGCCPLDHCPNVRPAFNALHDMGFTNLRVLLLPHDFATDWVEKGYPVEKAGK